MSATENLGNQQVTFDYKHPAKGRDFTRQLFSIIKPGIYRGLDVSIDTENKINISSGFAFLNCAFESEIVRGVLARFQTDIVSQTIEQSTPGQNEVVYLLFEYKEVTENWVGIYHAESGSELPNESLILCELEYDIDGNIQTVIYDSRTYGSLNQDYNIPDTNTFANYLDRTKKGKFDLSKVTPGETRKIGFPNYNYDLGTIDDWSPSRSYQAKEVVTYNSTLYRAIIPHTSSSSFFTDLANWENITEVSDEEKIRGFNNTGSILESSRIVVVSGDSTTEEIPEISYLTDYSEEPFGLVISDIATGESGELIQRGRIIIPSFDSSSGTIGQKVYSDSNGNLTLSITPLIVGQLLTPAVSNSVVYISILPQEEGINTINFNGQLSINENTIQKAFDRLDDYGYAPDWETGKDYRIGNLVVRIDDSSDSLWQCVSGHTSTVFSVDVSNWKPITDFTAIKTSERSDLTSSDPNISVSGGTGSVVDNVDISLVKYDLISDNSNLSVTGGVESVLKSVILKVSDDPEFNSINVNEVNLTTFTLISSSGSSGHIDNVDVSDVSIVKFEQSTTVTGFQRPASGYFKQLIVTNISAGNLVIANESGFSDFQNRIITGQQEDLTIETESSIKLYYDNTFARWRVIGGTGSGGGGGGAVTSFNSSTNFPLGTPVRFDGVNWLPASGTSEVSTVECVVSSKSGSGPYDYVAISVGELELTEAEWDIVTGESGGLTPGKNYFLSSTPAGRIQQTPGLLYAPVLKALSTTKAFISLSINTIESGVGDTFYRDQFTTVGDTDDVTLTYPPAGKSYIWLSLDGVNQHSDAFDIAGQTLSFSETIPTGVKIEVHYARAILLADPGAINRMVGFSEVVSGSPKSVFNLPTVPSGVGSCIVFVGGAIQNSTKWGLVDNVLTFIDDVPVDTEVVVYVLNSSGVTQIDSYVTRGQRTIIQDGDIDLDDVFGATVSGRYKFHEIENPLIEGKILLKYNGIGVDPDVRVVSEAPEITTTKDTASSINMYIESNVFRIQNKLTGDKTFVFYREL